MLRGVFHLLSIYSKLQLLHLRIYLEYRADFWIGVLGMLLTQGAGWIFIWTVFNRVPQVGGWKLWEIALLYALAIIPSGLTALFYDGHWQLRSLVNQGAFDRLLVRPISPALQVITQSSSIHGFGTVLLGLVILATAVYQLGLSWKLWQYGFLFLTLISAFICVGSVNFATNCIAFWDSSADGSFPFMVQNSLEFVKYPVHLYGRLIQFIITWILPFAFISYYPALVLLGKPVWFAYFSPLVGPIMALIASGIWRLGLLRYQGTGH
jgi:viologen exporter family transport system permease protein